MGATILEDTKVLNAKRTEEGWGITLDNGQVIKSKILVNASELIDVDLTKSLTTVLDIVNDVFFTFSFTFHSLILLYIKFFMLHLLNILLMLNDHLLNYQISEHLVMEY